MRRPALSLAALVMSVLLGSALLAGCASGEAGTESASERSFNKADVDFALQMQAHHQQALVMADMASARAKSQDVRRLAGKITKAQGREIDLMAGWIQQWAKQGAKLPGHGDGGHAAHGPGMMSESDMGRLEGMNGRRFDRMWLRMMVEHHRGALDMARAELQDGKNPQAKTLARDVLRTQKAEITQMRGMLAG